MSATGRGGEYEALARYYTPAPLARYLTGLLPIWERPLRVLEPHVGGGAFLAAALAMEKRFNVYHRLYAMDLDPGAAGLAIARSEGGWAGVGDFLSLRPPVSPDIVIGNPPYSIPGPERECDKCRIRSPQCPRCKGTGLWRPKPVAVAHLHIHRALDVVAPGGHVAYLLRLGIIEGRVRYPLFRDTPPRAIFALSTRPSFDGEGNDQTSYGFFWWQQGWKGDTIFRVVDWQSDCNHSTATLN